MPIYGFYIESNPTQSLPIPDTKIVDLVDPVTKAVTKTAVKELPSYPKKIDDVGDVIITNPQPGEILVYGSDGYWRNKVVVGASPSLAALTDVSLSSPTTGDVLTKTSGNWVNSPSPSGIVAVTQNFGSDGTLVIPAGETILSFMVKGTVNLTAFKVGTGSGLDDIISQQDIIENGKWHSFAINYKAVGAETWYVGGVSGTVSIQRIKV